MKMLALLLLVVFPAKAEQLVCGERKGIIETLNDIYHEQLTGAGITATGDLMEMYTSPNGSWTALVTTPGGASCVLGIGKDWEVFARVKPSRKA